MAAAFLGVYSQRVTQAYLIVLKPGAEDSKRSQIAAMFMRDDVIGVILANSVESEATFGFPRQEFAGHGSKRPRRLLRNRLQDGVHNFVREWLLSACPIAIRRVLV